MYDEFQDITYEVTPLTLAVLAKKDGHGKVNTVVIEEKGEYIVKDSPTKVMDEACKFFGSSLKGRQDGTRDISKITHKAPIAVDPSSGMYFFPTASPSNTSCSWIAHSHIKDINPIGKDNTEIEFKNGRRIAVKVSYGSMLNQVQRTAQFRYSLDTRMKYLKRKRDEEEKD